MTDTKLLATLEAFRSSEDSLATLGDIRRGIEKESLRVNKQGELAQNPHPHALGSSLTHPNITTDFSEAQLEMITGVHKNVESMLSELNEIHQFVYHNIDDQLLWSASMPCILGEPDNMPVGRYGTSNIGQLKTAYRNGLTLRYGKPMQMISGIHFNFSMSDIFWQRLLEIEKSSLSLQAFKTQRNFDMIRNFQRYSWLILYLFGASPALCKTFRQGDSLGMESLDEHTLFMPYATTLRMGKAGYQSTAQESVHVPFNDLKSYVHALTPALTTPYASYEAQGLQNADGTYKQLNGNLLQIENEFYGVIRPKCITQSGERPLNALVARGVEYVEVRLLDVNPFLPLGINASTVRFLDIFLLYCLLADSPADDADGTQRHALNRQLVVENGRKPGLMLQSETGEKSLVQWSEELFANCLAIAKGLDQAQADQGHPYQNVLAQKKVRIRHPDETPSGQVIASLKAYRAPFFRLAMNQSEKHQTWFKNHPLSAEALSRMQEKVKQSHASQSAIEAADDVDFETFRKRYIEQVISQL